MGTPLKCLSNNIEVSQQAVNEAALRNAFERFTQASAILERRYTDLRKETEELRQRLREKDEEIARSAKLAMLGETAAALAHEVRNPLGAIKLFLSLLRQDCQSNPAASELIDQMNKSVSALDGVVSNILQFTKSQEQQCAPINAHVIIQEQLAALFPQNSPQLKVILELEAKPFVLANEHSLRQVFSNLFLNALQAMRYRGTLSIHSRDDAAGNWTVEIRDTGPGIPSEVQKRLFEPFVTTKNEGTGLGLAIVKKILDQHRGSIEIQNIQGSSKSEAEGAVVNLCLPRQSRGNEIQERGIGNE